MEGRARSEDGKGGSVDRQDSSRAEADLFAMGTEPLTLQARLCCWHEADGRFNGSWDFGLSGHKMVHVDSSTGEWTEVDPGSRWMKELWNKNRDVTSFFKMTSQGDCRAWLQEVKSHWEEKLEPTGNWEEGKETHTDGVWWGGYVTI